MDKITEAVQAQYEMFPYPVIGDELSDLIPLPTSYDFAHYFCTHKKQARKKVRILDAGCGTGFSTLKLAQANPNAQITALDLSQSSLDIAKKRLDENGLSNNVSFSQADLMALKLDEKFDYIHCTGVLHHLSDPQVGLQNLAQHLEPDGLAYIMIYSKHSRHYVRLIQSTLRSLWKDTGDLKEGVNICRAFFQGLPDTHPLKMVFYSHKNVIREQFSEAFAESDHFLVDTYLQQCEHPIDLAEAFEHLDQSQLAFYRFLDEDAWTTGAYFPALPDYMADLSSREKYILVDPLRMDRNYAFFVGKDPIKRDSLKYNSVDIPLVSPGVMTQEVDGHLVLENQLGKQLTFEEPAQFLWEQIDGESTWEVILEKCAQKYGFNLMETEEGLRPLLEGLIQNYYVFA